MLTVLFWEGFACGFVVFAMLLVLAVRWARERRRANGPDVFVVLINGKLATASSTAELAVAAVNAFRAHDRSLKTTIVGYRPAAELEEMEGE